MTNSFDLRPSAGKGVFLILLALANLLIGFPKFGGEKFGAVVGGIFDVLLLGSLLVFGLWFLRMRVVAKDGNLRLVGVVEGQSEINIRVDELVSADFNHLRQAVELKTGSGRYFVRTKDKSDLHGKLRSLISGAEDGKPPA